MSVRCCRCAVNLDGNKQVMYIVLYHFCYDMKLMLTDDDVDNILENLLVLFPKGT